MISASADACRDNSNAPPGADVWRTSALQPCSQNTEAASTAARAPLPRPAIGFTTSTARIGFTLYNTQRGEGDGHVKRVGACSRTGSGPRSGPSGSCGMPTSTPAGSPLPISQCLVYGTRLRYPPGLKVMYSFSRSRSTTKFRLVIRNSSTASIGPGPNSGITGWPLMFVSSTMM